MFPLSDEIYKIQLLTRNDEINQSIKYKWCLLGVVYTTIPALNVWFLYVHLHASNFLGIIYDFLFCFTELHLHAYAVCPYVFKCNHFFI